MSNWIVISHTAPKDPGICYRMEVGIEDPNGGWAQVRVREFACEEHWEDLDIADIAAEQRATFLAEIEAEWDAAMNPGLPDENQLPGVGDSL